MGGITAHTVNFGPQARQMNDQLGEQLRQHIKPDERVRVTAILGDAEAYGFANQVMQWLKGHGFSAVEGVDQAVYTMPVSGQNINRTPDGVEIIIGSRQ